MKTLSKELQQFKNFDMTTMGYYSALDFKNLEHIKEQFNSVMVKSSYIQRISGKMWVKAESQALNDKEKERENPYIFKYFEPSFPEGVKAHGPDWHDYRVENWLGNSSDNHRDLPQLYCTQSETRNVGSRDIILFLDFPIWYFRDDVKNSWHGWFDYDMGDEFLREWDKEDNSYDSYTLLTEKYNKKYPEKNDGQFIWSKGLIPDLHASFRRYGILNIPIIDRPFTIFIGSSHTLFHACYMRWDTLKFFIKVPKNHKKDMRHKLLPGWYCYIEPNNFAEKKFNESKLFYVFYIDVKNEKLYGKKYDVSEFEYFRKNVQIMHLKEPNLYKEFDELI